MTTSATNFSIRSRSGLTASGGSKSMATWLSSALALGLQLGGEMRGEVEGHERDLIGLPGDRTAPPFGGAAGRGQAPTGDRTAPPFGGAAGRGQAPTGDRTAPPFGGAAGRRQASTGEALAAEPQLGDRGVADHDAGPH